MTVVSGHGREGLWEAPLQSEWHHFLNLGPELHKEEKSGRKDGLTTLFFLAQCDQPAVSAPVALASSPGWAITSNCASKRALPY